MLTLKGRIRTEDIDERATEGKAEKERGKNFGVGKEKYDTKCEAEKVV